MSAVRPQYGPGLPEVLESRFAIPARTVRRVAAAVAAVAILVLLVAALRHGSGGKTDVVVRRPIAFNLAYTSGALHRVAPRAGESLRLETRAGSTVPQSYTVAPLRLPAYAGDPFGTLPILATDLSEQMARRYPGYTPRGEGRTRINDNPGYVILFQARIGGRTTYGKRFLLIPAYDANEQPRDGLDVTLLSTRSPAIPNADAVGNNGALKSALRSVRFGTERP